MDMQAVTEVLGMLGKRARDRVTGFEGVIASACFDLYGCVQLTLTPPVKPETMGDKDAGYGRWFDASRIEITDHNRVMEVPGGFESYYAKPASQVRGPAEKPPRERDGR